MTICEFCGKEFKPKQDKKSYVQRYCSHSCSSRANKEKHDTKVLDKSRLKTCEYCGKEFIPKDEREYRFCSKRCSTKASWMNGTRKETQVQGKNRPLTPDTVHLVTMWHEQGDSPETIAHVLNRDIETINGILRGEIT